MKRTVAKNLFCAKMTVCFCAILLFALFITLTTPTGVIARAIEKEDEHAAIANTASSISLDFSFNGMTQAEKLRDEGTFTEFTLADEGYTLEPGKPKLPSVSRAIIVPADAGLELVVTASQPTRIRANHPPSVCTVEDLGDAYRGMQAEEIQGIYPAEVAEMSEPFVIRGVRMVRVTTYPLQYDPNTNEYIQYDDVRAEIQFTNDEPVNPVLVPERRNRSKEFLKFIRNFAMNGDVVGRDDPNRDREPEYVGHYLVVAHENCIEHAHEFFEWRRKSGWKVEFLAIPSNQANNPNSVKNAIQEVYDGYLDDGVDPFDHLLLFGDHSGYQLQPDRGWVLESFRGNSIWPHNCNHDDWQYACLEGDDDAADVGHARIIAGSQTTIAIFVNRLMSYETDPYWEDTDWFTRGAIYAQKWAGNYHVSLATNVRHAKSILEAKGFDDIRVNENMDQMERSGEVVGPFLTEQFNDGVNVLLGRAENYYYRQNFQGVRHTGIYPIDLNIAGHHEWSCWNMMRTGSPDNPVGPCTATTGWGGQQTLPYSITWLEHINGFMMHDQTYGWSAVKTLMGPEIYIPNFGQTYGQCKTDITFYGDPGIQYWQGVPDRVTAEFPERIGPDENLVEVQVYDEEGEEVYGGARVTLYAPNDMPNFNSDDYHDYDDMWMKTTLADENGLARFIIPEGTDFESDIFVTVNGRNVVPFFGEIEIERQRSGVEMAAYMIEEVEGNENEDINPGETFNLSITAHNLDNNDALEGVTAEIISMSPYVEVGENSVIEFGDMDGGAEVETDEPVQITFAPNTPDGASRPITKPIVKVVFTSGEETWETAIQFDPVAPNLVLEEISGGNQIDVDVEHLRIEIKNIGRMASPPITARLHTAGMGVSVVDGEREYEPINPGRSARQEGQGFTVNGNSIVVPGSFNDMILEFETEDGFVDSTFFTLQVGEARRNAPQGPDGYGYICFDDTDEDWDISPDYEWVEICPDDRDWDYEGRELDFDGNSPHNIGETIVVDLPFETGFYGRTYDQITVATNGFISMGDQEYVTNYQNWPMDRAIGGGVGMLAPLWDDLNIGDGGGVYTYHDEEDARFIIEWYKMRHRSGGNVDLIFQVILLDHDVWITETGDQNILFQYKSVRDIQGRAGWHTAAPYASVGISSPDGTTGINYRYNNQSPVTSAPLEDRRALLFATSPRYKACSLFGTVHEVASGEPVAEAVVATNHGFTAFTDENGEWRINDALAEVPFEIMCFKQGYNDTVVVQIDGENLVVPEDEEFEINFNLLHPEFTPSVEELEASLRPDESTELDFSVENTGTGPLDWYVDERLRGDANADPWEYRRSYNVSDITGDSRIQGIEYVGDLFYIASSNDREPQIYVMNQDGEVVNQFDQFGVDGSYGYKDLGWDGEWLWGSGDDNVFAFTPEGELMLEFDGPWNPNNNFAWDAEHELMWISSTTSDLVAVDREGNEVRELDRQGMRVYGLGYYPQDPDGFKLYMLHKDSELGDYMVVKMNTDNGDTTLVEVLDEDVNALGGGRPSGLCITNQFDVYSWVFIALSNDGSDDRVDIWQLDARKDWFSLEPKEGTLDPGDTQDFTLTLDATGLPTVLFEADLAFYNHTPQTLNNIFTIPVALDVVDVERPRELEIELMQGWNLISANVTAESNDPRDIVHPLVDAEILTILKDGMGRFYLPDMNFINIPEWNFAEGYQLAVTEAAVLTIEGLPIPADTPINLREGWNMVAYYPQVPVDAVVALAGIADNMDIAKNGMGNFYIPEFGFSNIGDMVEGQGYQMKLTEATELVYRLGEENIAAVIAAEPPSHFSEVSRSDEFMPVLLTADESMAKMEAAAFDAEGNLIGSGRFDNNGRCGIAAWKNEMLENAATSSEKQLTFKIWNGSEELDAKVDPAVGGMTWNPNGYMAGDITGTSVAPVEFGIHDSYPNPANGPVRLTFGMPEDGSMSLRIFDLAGRQVAELVRGNVEAGNHVVHWNTAPVASGVYIARLESVHGVNSRKIAVLK